MSDIMAETMVAEFKRLPQRAYLGGYTSCFGSRTHFQLATFYALTETPEFDLNAYDCHLSLPICYRRRKLINDALTINPSIAY